MKPILYLSVADAARILGVTPGTIRVMCSKGELPIAATTKSGVRLFDPAIVHRLAALRAERRRGIPGADRHAEQLEQLEHRNRNRRPRRRKPTPDVTPSDDE